MINWPAIIKHADDVELIYVDNEQTWQADAELSQFEYSEEDYLIDISGQLYGLIRQTDHIVQPQPLAQTITLKELLGLIKAHAAAQGSCCVAKLYAPDIRSAFQILQSLAQA